jgi:hypothetical protein
MNNYLAQIDFSKLKVPTSSNGLININSSTVTLGGIFSVILNTYIFYAAGIALLIYLIIGGLQMMLSKGDPKAVQAAQGKITNAVIGFVIVFLAYFIVQLLGQILGIKGTLFGQVFNAT